jgi:hypothetical protein
MPLSSPDSTQDHEPNRGLSLLKGAAVLVAVWAPFAGLWILFVRVFLQASLAEAVFSGVVAIGNAAILSVGVWWISGRYRWPRKLRPRFYLAHVLLGSAYSAAWIFMGHVVAQAQTGQNTLRMLVVSGLLGWRFIMGLWLYGLVAGVSYAIRVGRSLVEQERIAARAQALATEARLESLRSRLNPHFLYNALHTARSLVRTNPEVARDAIEELGRLLRYSLDGSERSRVPLAEELSFTRDYLVLEKLRLEERLGVEWETEPAAEACVVPPFLVQPLVENAVLHGISPAVDGGVVRIGARVEGDDLVVRVADDGIGRDPASVEEGRGHRLLLERMEATYGERASVRFDGRPGEGFEVTIRLPAEPGVREERMVPEMKARA